MLSVFETVTSLLGQDDHVQKLGALIQANPEQTASMVQTTTPALIGGLADKAAEPGGNEALVQLLDRDDGSVLTNLSGFLSGGDAAHGEEILDQVCGTNRARLVTALAEQSGGDQSTVSKLLPMLAPIVMGVVNARRKDDGLEDGGLISLLGTEKSELDRQGLFDFGWLEKVSGGAAATAAGIVATVGSEASPVGGTATALAERPRAMVADVADRTTSAAGAAVRTTSDISAGTPEHARGETNPSGSSGGRSDRPAKGGAMRWLPWIIGGVAVALFLAWALSQLGDGTDEFGDVGNNNAGDSAEIQSGAGDDAGVSDGDGGAADSSGDTVISDGDADSGVETNTDGGDSDGADNGSATPDAQALRAEINAALTAGGLTEVEAAVSDDGTVTLAGEVDSETVKAAVEAGINGVEGVTRVDNRIVVNGSADGATGSDDQAVDTINDQLNLDPVTFETASARITSEGWTVLDEAATYLIANPDVTIEIAGHTDSDGNETTNQILSQARADTVLAYLSDKGVEATRMTAKGYGEADPVASNDNAAGKAQNRRIDFVIL